MYCNYYRIIDCKLHVTTLDLQLWFRDLQKNTWVYRIASFSILRLDAFEPSIQGGNRRAAQKQLSNVRFVRRFLGRGWCSGQTDEFFWVFFFVKTPGGRVFLLNIIPKPPIKKTEPESSIDFWMWMSCCDWGEKGRVCRYAHKKEINQVALQVSGCGMRICGPFLHTFDMIINFDSTFGQDPKLNVTNHV